MLKKMAVIGGVVAVAGLGLGGAAWAESNSPAPQAVTASSQADAVVPAAYTAAPNTTAPSTSAPTTSANTAPAKAGKGKHAKRVALAKRLEKVSHAQWVSKDGKTGAFVTHDAVRGTVSAVSAGSITIKATDGTSETFAVNGTTKVHIKGAANAAAGTKAKAGTISQVKVGDRANVLGTGAGIKTATRVMDHGVPKAARTTAPTSAAPTTS